MITDGQRRLIDETLDRFDATKVASVMELLDWTWWDSEEKYPQPHEIRKKARWLLEEGFKFLNRNNSHNEMSGESFRSGTGGLYVEINTFTPEIDPDGNVYITLYFAAEQSECDSAWLDKEPSW